ncbi:MAG: hypothetical protein ACI8UD_000758 [Planctomycetota bacterium]
MRATQLLRDAISATAAQRFIMRNNVTTNPPVDPSLKTFAFSYRFERQ